ncbi:MAG: catC [Cypionkella sp.]|nr:catC [Cypionkella sp.]
MTDSASKPAGFRYSTAPAPTQKVDITTSDQQPSRGQGGELHQTVADGADKLTTSQGVSVSDNQNSLRATDRGPLLLEDFVLREKIFHFDHERIPERVVHARGYGAHGHFICTKPIPGITQAAPFQAENKETSVFVRFSTVAGAKGSMDLARDVRGFAVKFYTEEGNWDLVGNNIPVFFIQDPIKFPDLVHAVKPEADRGFPQAQSAHDTFWDYISLTPESMHMVMWQMSDRTIPRSFRMMEGFGVHTFRFVNESGESTFVKFHWKPHLGLQSVLWDEAVKINGADPDFHRRDLWNAIQYGDHPKWNLCVQVFTQTQADKLDFDILDPTKIIPEEIIPLVEIGTLTLTRMVDNFFQETEQVAFCTQNVIPGIDFTDDPLLQGRNFSYLDTQLKRLGGPNFTQIPINAPRGCPVHNYHQDGHMQTQNRKGRVNYEPNGFSDGPREDPLKGYVSFAARSPEGSKQRLRPESFADHYSQARLFYRSQTEIEQHHIADALVFELSKCQMLDIRKRMVAHLLNIDEDLAQQVANGLGFRDMPTPAVTAVPARDLDLSPALSILGTPPNMFLGRKLGVIIADGFDRDVLGELAAETLAEGGVMEVISVRVGGAIAADGSFVRADHLLRGAKSVLFDAVAILGGDAQASLARNPAAQEFLSDAHNHAKFIGHHGVDDLLSSAAGIVQDEGYTDLTAPGAAADFLVACRSLRLWSRTTALPREADAESLAPTA